MCKDRTIPVQDLKSPPPHILPCVFTLYTHLLNNNSVYKELKREIPGMVIWGLMNNLCLQVGPSQECITITMNIEEPDRVNTAMRWGYPGSTGQRLPDSTKPLPEPTVTYHHRFINILQDPLHGNLTLNVRGLSGFEIKGSGGAKCSQIEPKCS